MMREGAPKTIYRKDYTEPDFLISHVELAFVIDQGNTRVTSSLRIQRNGTHNRPLVLDGESLGLVSASIDDSGLDENAFKYVGGKLTVDTVPNQFVFGAVVDVVGVAAVVVDVVVVVVIDGRRGCCGGCCCCCCGGCCCWNCCCGVWCS